MKSTVLLTATSPHAYQEQLSRVPEIVAARAQAQDNALSAFIESKVAEFLEGDRKAYAVPEFADDLRRRLRESASEALSDGRALDREAAAAAIKALAESPAEEPPPPESLRFVMSNGDAQISIPFGRLEGLFFSVALEFVWGEVLPAWRDAVQVVRLPGPLMIGDGALAPLFGRRFRARGKGQKAPPFELGVQREQNPTKVHRIVLSSGARQLSLWSPGVVRLVNPSHDEIVSELARVLDNGAWRMLLCCFAAAQEDVRIGRAPEGAFLYTPTAFAEMHGVQRQANGTAAGRISKEHVSLMDSRLGMLGNAGFQATAKIAGKPHTIKADKLVYPAHVEITEAGPSGREGSRRGRRSETLYRINDALLQLLHLEGAWWFPIRRSALAAPFGVKQPTWDDALKLFCLLAAKARAGAEAAKSVKGLPWTWTLDELLTQANVAGENRPVRQVRATGKALLGLLGDAGLIRFDVAGEGEDARVRFDVPEQRQRLASIRPARARRALPAKR